MRYWNVFLAILLLTLMLTQYQNCALKTPSNASSDPSPPETMANVQIVQDLSANEVAFVQTHVDVFDAAHAIIIDGLCAGTADPNLNWLLKSPSGQVQQSGQTTCGAGAFSVSLQKISEWPCGSNETLTVAPKNSVGASLVISRKCAPALAKQLTASNDGKDQCYIELEGSNPVQCRSVCYHSMQVVLARDLSAAECSDLSP